MAKNDETHNSEGKMSREEAGRLGGEATSREHDHSYYEQIGSQQGKENNPGNFANRPKKDVEEAGRKGGESSGHNSDNSNDE